MPEREALANRSRAQRIAEAVLYEGYLLYPYRSSSAKNHHRFTFGTLFPRGCQGEPSQLKLQCLLRGSADARIETRVRFLQIVQHGDWQEAREREAQPGRTRLEAGCDGDRCWDALDADVQLVRDEISANVWRVTVIVSNCAEHRSGATRDESLRHALASTHVLLEAQGGSFVSLADPPADLAAAAAACRNEGVWPVLIGSVTASDTLLASPIVLPDDPQIAPESPGALYDSTEIDEILSLRVLTLTDAEKREAAALDGRARELIERTESLTPAEWEALHGRLSNPRQLKVGSRVRIHPRTRSDVFDIALAGKVAIVESVEHDFDNRTHVAVALEDDPGRDLGMDRMPGHRFFYSPEELEPVS